MIGAYVVLSPFDREKYDCSDRLPYDLTIITAQEQATLQKVFGYHTPEDIAVAISAMVVDTEKKLVVRNPDVYLTLTWLALRQNGHLSAKRRDGMVTELSDLDIRLAQTLLDFDADEENEDEAAGGKDESSTPTETLTV